MDMNRTPPWSLQESLVEMTATAGIDYDKFVACMREDFTLDELAQRFQVSEATIKCLQDHFITHGISSVVGGD